MRIIFNTALLIVAFILNVQGQNQFQSNMQKAMQSWGQGKSTEAISILERIASVEKQQWLPHYYIGLICATDVFKHKASQPAEMIKKANKATEAAMKISKDNSELYCLSGLIKTAEITLDPMNNGRRLSPLVIKDYKKALALDNNNPRASYLLAEYQINMAKMFGNDPSEYFKLLKSSKEKFDNFKAPYAFYPNWGKERVEQMLNSNNETK
ncbi:hypothetical protein EMN47_08820 [Prolixibacteraceae bacterium JC049]|nr:hypothetical protein [Prolixibacteraceae bacterium JC049]